MSQASKPLHKTPSGSTTRSRVQNHQWMKWSQSQGSYVLASMQFNFTMEVFGFVTHEIQYIPSISKYVLWQMCRKQTSTNISSPLWTTSEASRTWPETMSIEVEAKSAEASRPSKDWLWVSLSDWLFPVDQACFLSTCYACKTTDVRSWYPPASICQATLR